MYVIFCQTVLIFLLRPENGHWKTLRFPTLEFVLLFNFSATSFGMCAVRIKRSDPSWDNKVSLSELSAYLKDNTKTKKEKNPNPEPLFSLKVASPTFDNPRPQS